MSRARRRSGGALPLTFLIYVTQWTEGESSQKAAFPLSYNSKCLG